MEITEVQRLRETEVAVDVDIVAGTIDVRIAEYEHCGIHDKIVRRIVIAAIGVFPSALKRFVDRQGIFDRGYVIVREGRNGERVLTGLVRHHRERDRLGHGRVLILIALEGDGVFDGVVDLPA